MAEYDKAYDRPGIFMSFQTSRYLKNSTSDTWGVQSIDDYTESASKYTWKHFYEGLGLG